MATKKAEINFTTGYSHKEVIATFAANGLDLSVPTVIGLMPSKSKKGYNAIIAQILKDVPSSKSATGSANPFLNAVKSTGWNLSGNDSFVYLGTTIKYFDANKAPSIGETFPTLEILVYDTTDLSEATALNPINTEETARQDKSGSKLTVNGNPVYRVHVLIEKSFGYNHKVETVDATPSTQQNLEMGIKSAFLKAPKL